MNRAAALEAIERGSRWDVLVIGGGASGLGAAVDAASRGFRTLLLEAHDFAKGTSSRSTKLIHGGVRYLKQGNLSLVRESLRERGILLRNAPHLAAPLGFVIPVFSTWELGFYGAGLKVYDLLAGALRLEPTRLLNRADVTSMMPGLRTDPLRGGVRYVDGQFDDARLAVSLAATVFDLGGVALNYAPVVRMLKENGRVAGVVAHDTQSGRELNVRARTVINATGVFADAVRRLDEPAAETSLAISQGAHVVLSRSFLPGRDALMIPKTSDGRVLFAIPWRDHVIVGTTDVPVAEASLEPRPAAQEMDFILETAGRFLAKAPGPADVLSCFAGLRPLVKGDAITSTARLSRDHVLIVSSSGLITVIGGKWTTYRRMAQDVVDRAIQVASLEARPCQTETLHLHGYLSEADGEDVSAHRRVYGAEEKALGTLPADELHSRLPFIVAEVIWAARHEMAMTVEDVLARRTRALFLDARAAREMAPAVAALLARELGRDAAWQAQQVRDFNELARRYLPS